MNQKLFVNKDSDLVIFIMSCTDFPLKGKHYTVVKDKFLYAQFLPDIVQLDILRKNIFESFEW